MRTFPWRIVRFSFSHCGAQFLRGGIMKKKRWINVYGEQRVDLEPDLMAQLVLMLARQLQQETMTDDAPAPTRDETADSEAGPGTTPDSDPEDAS
jgi:hypothetical protein